MAFHPKVFPEKRLSWLLRVIYVYQSKPNSFTDRDCGFFLVNWWIFLAPFLMIKIIEQSWTETRTY